MPPPANAIARLGRLLWGSFRSAIAAAHIQAVNNARQQQSALLAAIDAEEALRPPGRFMISSIFSNVQQRPMDAVDGRRVLGLNSEAASLADIDRAYRTLAGLNHPSRGGSEYLQCKLAAARQAAAGSADDSDNS